MPKQLMIAYTAEGSTDKVFLGIIIDRTLDDISRRHGNAFHLISVVWLGAAKGTATLDKIQAAFDQGTQLIIIHRDTDQHQPAKILQDHFQPLLDQVSTELRSQLPIVPLIIRHEQETWMFADLDALDEVMRGKLVRKNLNLPPNLEARANTKELFKQAIRDANQGQSRGRGLQENDVAKLLAGKINLEKIARLPSYQQFVTDLEVALRQINYIR